MHKPCNLKREPPPRHTAGWVLSLFTFQVRDLFQWQEREDAQVTPHAAVVGVDPVLVELVRRGHLRIEEERAFLALAQLCAGGRGDQRRSQRVYVCVACAADEINARQEIAPLIVPPTF